jgi:UbiD family decarboxylase
LNLEELLAFARRLGKEVKDVGLVPRERAVTMHSMHNRDKVLLFRLEDLSDFVIYSNLVTSRRDVQRLVNAGTLEESYYALDRAMSSPTELQKVAFYEYFEDTSWQLSDLPFLKFYGEDGGYYLTSSIYIACYESICNASYHRTMYLSPRKATLRIVPRHLHYIITKHFERGRDAPVALVLGVDPLQELAAALSPPLGVFEVSVGAALGGSKQVAETPLYRIPVPASASVVVEGTISRNEKAVEGPFTDMLLLLDEAREQPVFNVEAIYTSKSKPPVVHAIVPGLWEHQLLMGFPREAQIYIEVKRVVPCAEAVRLTEGGAMWLHAVVVVGEKCSEGDARLAALAAISAHPSVKHVLVVDSDIDPDNPLLLEWAIATRLKAGEDLIVLKNVRGSTLEPRAKNGIGDKLVLIAIKPRKEDPLKYKRVAV